MFFKKRFGFVNLFFWMKFRNSFGFVPSGYMKRRVTQGYVDHRLSDIAKWIDAQPKPDPQNLKETRRYKRWERHFRRAHKLAKDAGYVVLEKHTDYLSEKVH